MTFLPNMVRTTPSWCTSQVTDDTSAFKCSVTPLMILGGKFLTIVDFILPTAFLTTFKHAESIAVEPSVDVSSSINLDRHGGREEREIGGSHGQIQPYRHTCTVQQYCRFYISNAEIEIVPINPSFLPSCLLLWCIGTFSG